MFVVLNMLEMKTSTFRTAFKCASPSKHWEYFCVYVPYLSYFEMFMKFSNISSIEICDGITSLFLNHVFAHFTSNNAM